MANIGLRNVILYDKWPGPVNPRAAVPPNGFDSTLPGSGNCVSEPLYLPGTKIQGYNDGTYNPGYYTMCYMQFAESSSTLQDIGDASDGWRLCFHYDATGNSDSATPAETWYIVTNCKTESDMTIAGRTAIPACDLSGNIVGNERAEWGWFWVGGVCPCVTAHGCDLTDGLMAGSLITGTDCTKLGEAGGPVTDGDVAAGQELCLIGDGSACPKLIPWAFSALWAVTAKFDSSGWQSPIGYSLATDG